MVMLAKLLSTVFIALLIIGVAGAIHPTLGAFVILVLITALR